MKLEKLLDHWFEWHPTLTKQEYEEAKNVLKLKIQVRPLLERKRPIYNEPVFKKVIYDDSE